MNDNEFWIKCWKYAAIVFCIVVMGSIGSCQSSKYQIRKMVEAGSSATEAACAYEIHSGEMGAGGAALCLQVINDLATD